MSIREIKNVVSSNKSYDEWEQIALKVLKRNSLEALYNDTYEGIKLAPIYVKKDVKNRLGDSCSRRDHNNWRIAQKLNSSNWDDLKQQIVKAKEWGHETISVDIDNLHDLTRLNFAELSEIVNLNTTPLLLFTKLSFPIIAHKLLQIDAGDVSGAVAVDLISSRLEQGYLYKREGQTWENWQKMISMLDEKYPKLRTILIDSTPYHNSGANAIQELAASLSEAIFYIEEMRKIGWDPQKTMGKMIFHFSIGNHFFMEIAKIRAFRILWDTICSAYEIDFIENSPLISAETSTFTKSLLEPYNNILRSGNEAFAAVIAGVDFLHVTPFAISDPSDAFAMRIARNTQLLLREESYLERVVDPAGGSFYVETLTGEVVEKAWEFFQAIDYNGGIYSVLQSGWLQLKVKETLTKRLEDIQSRKKSMIGVNVFKRDSNIPSIQKSKPKYNIELDCVKIEPLVQLRLAEKSESGDF